MLQISSENMKGSVNDSKTNKKNKRSRKKPIPLFDADKVIKEVKIKVKHAKRKDDPFLSIVTRCYERPHFLYILQSTLQTQSDQDFEHILLSG